MRSPAPASDSRGRPHGGARRRLGRGLVLGVALLATGACTPMDDVMVAVFGRSMRNQVTYDPYEQPLLPADNSVPFAAANFPAERGDVNLGQPEVQEYLVPDFTQAQTANPQLDFWVENPVPADEASLARGQELYNCYCIVCPGPAGIGAEAYILEKWPALAVYNLAGETVQAYSDPYIYGMIRVGRGLMPQYGHQITHFDRWNIVNYVRQLQAAYTADQQAQAAADDLQPQGGPDRAGDRDGVED
ncbi:MAG: cytochrome c [Gemmatimonadota bacterium]